MCTRSLREAYARKHISSYFHHRRYWQEWLCHSNFTHYLHRLFACVQCRDLVPCRPLAKHRNHETQHIQAIKLYEKGYLRKEPTRRHSPTMPTRAYAPKRICLREQTTGQPPYNSFHVQKRLSSLEDVHLCESNSLLGTSGEAKAEPPSLVRFNTN